MSTHTVTVASSVGLHARPAALLASAVNDSGLDVTIVLPGGDAVDAGSILEVMTLGAAHAISSRCPPTATGPMPSSTRWSSSCPATSTTSR